MQIQKKYLASLLIIGTINLPLSTYAGNLIVSNNTNQDSTSIINHGACSNTLPGGIGITHAHQTNSVPETILKLACLTNTTNCQADVYMTSNCTGPAIGTVTLNVSTGITGVYNIPGSGYVINGGGFNIQVSGGH